MAGERKERTLPPRPASDDEVEAEDTADTTTVVEFTPVPLTASREVVTPEADEPEEAVPESAESEDAAPEHAGEVPATAAESLRAEPDAPESEDAGAVPAERGTRAGSVFRTCAKVVAWLAVFPVLCILPFIVVLRISVVSYQESMYNGWESLGLGMLAAVFLVCVYIAAFMWSFGIRRRHFMSLLNVCLTAMLVYCGYALFHLATTNAKTEEVRSYYTSLHPFLRVAVKNLTFFDSELVITDVHRTKEEYERMGLRPLEYSLHFKQPTGFVHAVDLRTNGRPQVNNLLVELYFILMGFETIRHVGTADHIHVSLPLSKEDLAAAAASGDD